LLLSLLGQENETSRTLFAGNFMQKTGLTSTAIRRALLLCNPIAGGGQRTRESFCRLLESAGYACEPYATDDPQWRAAASADTLVVVAGGDGTIKEVAPQLVGTDIPLAILPVGTSNNLALTLGVFGSPSSLFARWPNWHPQPFDVVSVTTPHERRFCFEGCGFGLLGRWMHLGKYMPDRYPPETRKQVVRQDRKFLSGVAESATCDECTIELNGETLTDEYLMVVIANIGMMGARIPLAPQADPSDGLVDVLLARPKNRTALVHWLRGVAAGDSMPPPPLEAHQASEVSLRFERGGYHFDDEAGLWGCENLPTERGAMSITAAVRPGALQILRP
jgi:diacylglycerol kinase (ATP)